MRRSAPGRPRRPAPYAWQCFVCEASNPATAALCSACGFPARATGRQIDAARVARSTAAAKPILLQDRSAIDSFVDALSPLPMWRKALVVGGGSLFAGGMLWIKFTMSLAEVAWGLGASTLGIVVMAAAQVGAGRAGSASTSNAVDR